MQRVWNAGVGVTAVTAVLLAAVGLARWGIRTARRNRKPKDPEFSRDYAEARAKFLDAARRAGAELSSHLVGTDASRDVELTIDAALLPGSKRQVILHLSGTHGVEGFAGSAIQVRLLNSWRARRAAHPNPGELPTVLFVHAVNPFGFHFLRRFNERNVDLNRNFLLTEADWEEVNQRKPNAFHYEDVRALLNPPRTLQWYEWYPTTLWNIWKTRRHFKNVRKAVVTGQYHDPHGVYFGGNSLERSNQVLCDLVDAHARDAEVVIALDVHSGLGDSGVDTLMVDSAERCQAFFPSLTFAGAGEGPVAAGYEDMKGGVNVADVLPRAKVALHITQEFGTLSPPEVLTALVFENAAYNNTPIWSETRTWAALALRDAFYVPTDEWRASVLGRGVKLFDHVLTRLGA